MLQIFSLLVSGVLDYITPQPYRALPIVTVCRYCILLLLVCCSYLPVYGQASTLRPVVLAADSGNIHLNELEVFEDASAALTLSEVLLPQTDKQFRPYHGAPNFGHTRSAIWLRVKLVNRSDSHWLLSLDGDMRDGFLSVHALSENQPSNNHLDHSKERVVLHPSPAYTLDLSRDETYTLYIRAQNLSSTLQFNLDLSRADDFTSGTLLRQLLFGIGAGACLALALYNLLLFFTFYEYSYISLFGMILFWVLDIGHGIFLTFVDQSRYIPFRYVFAMFGMAFLLQLVRQVVRPQSSALNGYDKAADKALVLLIGLALLMNVILPLLEFKQLYLFAFISLLMPVILLVVIRATWLNRPMAKWFLLALFFLISMVGLFNELVMLDFISYEGNNQIMRPGLIPGIGMLLFLFALSLMQISRTRQLRDERERAKASDHAKSNFLSTMSHELRTPMNAISGLAQLMQATQMDKQQQEYIAKVSVASNHMLTLVNDILDFSEIEQTKITLEQEEFDPHQLVVDISHILSQQAEQQGLSFICECLLPDNARLKGDRRRLIQVLLNLCTNALKFTERGNVCLLIKAKGIDSPDLPERLTITFSVTDTGIGIEEAKISLLFKPFSQLDTGTSRRRGGSGLGLYICHRLVSAMGGELTVSSTPGKGSCFSFAADFELVDAVSEKKQAVLPIKPKLEVSQCLSGKRVLLVDDDKLNRYVAKRLLERHGIVVQTVSSGQAAIDTVHVEHAKPFDLVFMDVSMPGIDGYAATRKIRQSGFSDLPIVGLTAHAIKGEKERCLAAGMNDFYTKPFTTTLLDQVLLQWLGDSACVVRRTR